MVTQSVSLLAAVVGSSGGHVVKTLGDGLMAMFSAASAGVAAAVEMHEAMERWDGPVRDGGELHNDRYDFNDAILPAASGWLAAVAKQALSANAPAK